MKIESETHEDNINISGDFSDSIQAGMDESSLPFILEMLSKNFYSNPIGSICREITSNCFDSHIEAKVEDAVIITIGTNDELEDYISFTDVGAGLSPERIKKIYMKYFTSTKRDTNDQIGGFGLGSKTPLAYQDYFFITTIFDGIKYSYLFSKGIKLPTLDLLLQEETTEHNGTEIKIIIKNFNDKTRFINELKSQLCYFDNVVFKGCGISNDYRIYETDLFKYKNMNQYSDEMHICFGKVAYPIDWNQLGIPYVEVPVGVKFEIHELVVTPNREMLRYTDEVKKLVKERVLKTIEELGKLYIAQQSQYEDYFEWYKVKTKRKYLYLGEEKEDTLELKGFKSLKDANTLKIISELKLNNELFESDIINKLYTCTNQLINNKIIPYSTNVGFTMLINDFPKRYLLCNDNNFSNIKNYYHQSGIFFKRIPLKQVFKSLLTSNNTVNYRNRIIKTDEIKKHINNTYSINNDACYFNDEYFDLGISMKIYKLIKYLRNQVESKIKNYHIEVTDSIKKDYKDFIDEKDKSKQRKLEGKVFCKDITRGGSDYEWKIEDVGKRRNKIIGIENYKGIVVYGFQKDKKLLEKAHVYCYLNPNFRVKEDKGFTGYVNTKSCKVIQIAQNNEKHFKNKPNMIHVTKLYGDNRIFRKLASSFRIEKILADHISKYSNWDKSFFLKQMMIINSEVGTALFDIKKFYEKFTNAEDIRYATIMRKDLKDEILAIATKNNLFDIEMEAKIKIVENFFNGIELLKHIEINNETLPLVLKYLREKKKRINLEYYCKIVTPELQPEFNFDVEEKEEQLVITKFRKLTEVA